MNFLQLEGSIRWIFLAHALLGALALFVLGVPLFTKKGGKTHVRSGWIYTGAMLLVGVSAIVITPWRLGFDPSRTPRSQSFAAFLFFVALFTLSALSYGIQALKNKRRQAASRELRHIGPPVALIVVGVFTVGLGIVRSEPLLILFPAFAFLTAKMQLSYWLNAPKQRMHWWYAHMSGMGTACIATITAFLVTALPRLVPGTVSSSPVLWITPGVILGAVFGRWTKRYQVQFGDN